MKGMGFFTPTFGWEKADSFDLAQEKKENRQLPKQTLEKLKSRARKRLREEFKEFIESDYPYTVVPVKDNLFHWEAVLPGPKGTSYEGGLFFLDIKFSIHYPFRPPNVKFTNKIFHIKVKENGRLWFNLHFWSESRRVSKLVDDLYNTFINPDYWIEYACGCFGCCQDRNDVIASMYETAPKEYVKQTQSFTMRYANPSAPNPKMSSKMRTRPKRPRRSKPSSRNTTQTPSQRETRPNYRRPRARRRRKRRSRPRAAANRPLGQRTERSRRRSCATRSKT